ncbi:hypothetical protein KEM52_000834, partial [Ascosphaera acerosa]
VERRYLRVKFTASTSARIREFVETTNDFTWNLSAALRYWKAPLELDNRNRGWACALTINDALIPTNSGKGATHGTSYKYVGLPVFNDTKHLADLPLGGNNLRWLDVSELLERSANVVITVNVKAKTTDGSERSSFTPVTITVHVLRAVVHSVGGEVDKPMFKAQLQSASRIALTTDVLEALMTDKDFNNAVAKRLGKLRQRCLMRIHALVASVVAVTNYSLKQNTLNGPHQDLFRSVWEFLDTIKPLNTP